MPLDEARRRREETANRISLAFALSFLGMVFAVALAVAVAAIAGYIK